MLTLGIDTSGDTCAVALLHDTAVLFQAALHVPRAHGRRLAPLIDQAFAHTGRAVSDLDLVAVSAGPGSYTGLRIGMSTAKGLALATGAAFAAVPTLQALAATAHASGTVVAVMPSRRGEVYAAAYRQGHEVMAPVALAVDAVAGWLPPDACAIGGPGADRLDLDLARVEMHASGLAVARLGAERVRRDGPDDPASAEPFYLKPVATTQPRGIFGA